MDLLPVGYFFSFREKNFWPVCSFWVTTQCLAFSFSSQETSWIFDTSCQDLGNNPWQGSQGFERFLKIVQRNPKIFRTSLQQNRKYPRYWQKKQILHQSNTKSIDIYKQLFLNTRKRGYPRVCFHLNLNLASQKKSEAKINWNKVGAKMKHIGMRIMVQTSSIKVCDFFNLFRVYWWIDFELEEILAMFPPPSCRNLDPR